VRTSSWSSAIRTDVTAAAPPRPRTRRPPRGRRAARRRAGAPDGTRLSAPSFIVAAELLGAVLAVRRRAGAALVVLASGLSLAAATFDGDLGHAGLTGAEAAWQGVEVAASAVVFALARAAHS
jgi:hypothetical protein